MWRVGIGLCSLGLLMGALGAALWWAVRTEEGSAWLVSRLPGVEVTAPRGALWGDFETGRVVLTLSGTDQIVFTGLGWRGLHLARSDAPGVWARLSATELHASRIDVLLAPSDGPMTAPAHLHLPLQIDVEALQIGVLQASALGSHPLRDLHARVQLGATDGAEHRLEALSAGWDRLQASGTARIATRAPFTVDVSLAVSQAQVAAGGSATPAPTASQAASPIDLVDPAAWQATLALAGPLDTPTLKASVQSPATAAHPAQSLTAQAGLRPFAAWPLADLQAQTRALDLSALSHSAPITALTGEVTVQSTALDRPIAAHVNLSNDLAGRWNDGYVPLRQLTADLSARADDPSTVELKTFEAEFGTRTQAGGSLTGSGRWHADRSTLTATLHALQPSLLDARAPAMSIGGPLSLAVVAPTSASATPASGAASSPTVAVAAATPQLELQLDLSGALSPAAGSGQVVTAGKTVRLKLDAVADAQHLTLREARASAGGALATLVGEAHRTATSEPWRTKGRATLVDFDPLPWWPGRTDSPWRRGAHRFNATGDFDLTLPTHGDAQPTAWSGNAQLALVNSIIGGTPLEGQASLRSVDSTHAEAALALQVAGNQLQAQGRFDTTARASAARGRTDRWSIHLDAPTLAAFEPLWRLVQAPGADATLAGAVQASATLDGRWPEVSTQGELNASGLRVGAITIQQTRARWNAGTAQGAAVDVDASLSQLKLLSASSPHAPAGASPSMDSAQLTVKGSAGEHAVELRASSNALPPAWADTVQAAAPAQPAPNAPGASPAARSALLLQARGGVIDLADRQVAGWRGRVQRLDLKASPGNAAPWIGAGDVDIDAVWAGAPARLTVQPGQAEVLGAAVRWSQLSWQAAGGIAQPARIDAQLSFDPIPLAPLLARLQPGFGWGGDLTMGGRFEAHSDGGLTASLVLERGRGDLTVTDEISTQSLGLTNLRLALNATDGVWTFSQYLNGKTLGVLAGAVLVRTSPEALWPTPDATIEGAAELDVANLGAWGTWVPTGWRLGGQMKTSAVFSGRFGAPEITGSIQGSALSARNFLEGVNISDGEVLISLQGSGARIERFTAKGGAGSLRVDGSATLGESPSANLQLKAERFVLLGRVDRRIVTSGTAQLGFERDALSVNGGFAIDEGLIDFTRSDAPTLSDDVQVVRAAASGATRGAPGETPGAGDAAPPLPTPATSRNVALDLKIGLGNKLRLRGRGIETGLRGDLRLTAPGGRLAINGTIAAAGGTYAAYGQKLTIDRGQITFNGPPENPQLNIEATRPNIDIRVGVQVTGTAQNPRIRLFSEPEVSEVDKLSWLALGRASDGLGGADTALLQTAALALLAGEGDGITDQFTKAIGLDELTLKQNQGEVRETVISLGKQLSRRWYVGYERGLNATAGSFQLIYRIARSFTLRAQSGFENSLDVIWTWRWG
jgi:translocation and assembly module TamB